MAEEIREAVEIVKVAYDGIEIAMKIGGDSLKTVKAVMDVLKGILDYEKSIGRTNMRKLLMKGGDLQVFQFDAKDMKRVQKWAKKYGISYSVLPNINKDKGKREIVFHSEATPRINMLIQKLKTGKIASFDEYLLEDGAKNAKEITKFLNKQKGNALNHADEETAKAIEDLIEKVGNFAVEKDFVSVDGVAKEFEVDTDEAENVLTKLESIGVLDKKDDEGRRKVIVDKEALQKRLEGYRRISERLLASSMARMENMKDITISKTLIKEENDIAVKTRVPGTFGPNVRYLWVNKGKAMEIHNGKTILTFIDKEKDYKLYDEQNRVVETQKGTDLYKYHYDPVEAGVRARYEKMLKEREKLKRDRRRNAEQQSRVRWNMDNNGNNNRKK